MTTRLAASRPAPRSSAGGKAPAGKGNGRNALLPDGASEFLVRRAKEAGGLGVVLAAGALAAALASYDPGDPSLSTAAASDVAPVSNLLGLGGAYMADLLIQTLGLAAWLMAVIVAGWGLRVMRHATTGRKTWRFLAALAAIIVTSMALAGLSAPAGGAAGGGVGRILLSETSRGLMGLVGWSSPFLLGALAAIPGFLLLMSALGVPLRSLKPGLSGLRDGLSGGVSGAVGGVTGGLSGIAASVTGLLSRRKDEPEERPVRPAGPRRAPSLGGPALEEAPRPLRAEPSLAIPKLERNAPALDDDEDGEEGDAPRRTRPAAVVEPPPKPRMVEVARREAPRQSKLDLEPEASPGDYELPPLDLLQLPDPAQRSVTLDEAALQQNAELLESVLEDFGVRGEIVKVHPGPVVTLYELEPAPGTKSSRVIDLADDIARSMSAVSVRVAVVPGRNVIGIEMPNAKRETVLLRELLAAESYDKTQQKLALVLGKDIGGQPVIADLARMPHLLVAGTTGSGKSVAINTMILSLLYRLPPEKCRFIMVDPKMLELSVYEGIPHLLAPVVTDPKKAVVALKWTVREMEDRYRAMSKLGVRNIDGYNARLKEARDNGEVLTRRVQTGFDPDTGKPVFEDTPIDLTELPYIVVIVDEMADLMLVAGKDIEAAIQRLAQMARAAGIHIIMATQRPSVDVITGTIKANFPTRISFQVTSKIDSRTILGEQGAEQLLGQGDMLYMAGGGRITRVHGPFVRDQEVEEVVKHLKAQGEPMYVDAVTEDEEGGAPFDMDEGGGGGGKGGESSGDDLYDQAVALVARERKASTSFIQRHLRIGYNSAARLIERMEQEGVVSRANHVGKREVLARDIDDMAS